MEPKFLEIIPCSNDMRKNQMIVEQLVKSILPIITKQEHKAKKLTIKTLKDTPPIYLS